VTSRGSAPERRVEQLEQRLTIDRDGTVIDQRAESRPPDINRRYRPGPPLKTCVFESPSSSPNEPIAEPVFTSWAFTLGPPQTKSRRHVPWKAIE